MKKTLFALAALATMMPAMADTTDIELASSGYAKANNSSGSYDTDFLRYDMYLVEAPDTDKEALSFTLSQLTYIEFSQTYTITYLAKGDGADGKFIHFDFSEQPHILTALPSTDFYGVCVYQNEETPQFQIIPVYAPNKNFWRIDADEGSTPTAYASFKSGSPATPEPATATLSLMALAGLCARRRRK